MISDRGEHMSKYTDILKYWLNNIPKTAAELDSKLQNFRILFAYNSGRIENSDITWHDTREIFENGQVLNYSGDPRALFELHNQKLCYEYLLPLIIAKREISVELILEVHRILTSGTYDRRRYIENGERPGKFKQHDYITGRKEVGSAAAYVEKDIEDLVSELVNVNSDSVLQAAAYFHAVFENIHPFADGNGRVGRALMNYFLMIHNHPPLIIYDEDKKLYYECLEKYDDYEEINQLVEFMKYETEKTWAATLNIQNNRNKPQKPLHDHINTTEQ